LEDEQKVVRDLTQKPVEVFQSVTETPTEVKEEKIVFELIEEEVAEAPKAVSAIDDNELIAMNEFIRNLDVTFEIISPIKDIDFKVTTPEVKDTSVSELVQQINVVEAKNVTEEEQITFTFDIPAVSNEVKEENKVVFELTDETKNIVVKEPVQVVPMTELNEQGVIKYSLEEYMELENDLLASKPTEKVVEEPIAEELNITMKQVETEKPATFTANFEDVSPVEMTIEETLKHRADERRRKLKEFNYKFHNNPSRIDEMEKEPAYKRLGVDLSNDATANNSSRMSLGTDSNDDIQLRSNNSFLHDNVD
jgi:cell division protein FtsZ